VSHLPQENTRENASEREKRGRYNTPAPNRRHAAHRDAAALAPRTAAPTAPVASHHWAEGRVVFAPRPILSALGPVWVGFPSQPTGAAVDDRGESTPSAPGADRGPGFPDHRSRFSCHGRPRATAVACSLWPPSDAARGRRASGAAGVDSLCSGAMTAMVYSERERERERETDRQTDRSLVYLYWPCLKAMAAPTMRRRPRALLPHAATTRRTSRLWPPR
jgi:hypothetical protein